MFKVCVTCKNEKPLSEYGVLRSQPDGLNKTCKECNKVASKKYRDANKQLIAKKANANELRTKQDNSCGICENEFIDDNYVIDHDHSHCPGNKGCPVCVRGLLCQSCNLMLGAAKDNENTLIRGAMWLALGKSQTNGVSLDAVTGARITYEDDEDGTEEFYLEGIRMKGVDF